MKQIFYYREETTQGVAFLKSEIRCSISSKKVLCITKKKNRPTLGYILKKVWKPIKTVLSESVLKCLEKSLKEYLYKCYRYHCFCRFRQEFVINSEPSIVFQP